MYRQHCLLPHEGANLAASRTYSISFFGIVVGLNFLTLRLFLTTSINSNSYTEGDGKKQVEMLLAASSEGLEEDVDSLKELTRVPAV